MSRCTETGKPLIAILMAVYEPRLDWLKEQLDSLEKQTYPNLRLFIRDDCSPTVPFEDIQDCIENCIHSFPYEIQRNEKNLGSNKTFEQLTEDAEGEYFAYCDQDDIWLPEKLAVLQEKFEGGTAKMAYCDMRVIDSTGNMLAHSLRQVRPRLRYMSGENLAETYFFRNCTAGCAMLVRAETAKKAVPFPVQTVWDQWVAIVAAIYGKIVFIPQQLVQYRQHGGNQTGILHGVTNRAEYFQQKVEPLQERLEFYKNYAVPRQEMRDFIEARLKQKIFGIWRYRNYSRYEATFEVASAFFPDCLVRLLLRRST